MDINDGVGLPGYKLLIPIVYIMHWFFFYIKEHMQTDLGPYVISRFNIILKCFLVVH